MTGRNRGCRNRVVGKISFAQAESMRLLSNADSPTAWTWLLESAQDFQSRLWVRNHTICRRCFRSPSPGRGENDLLRATPTSWRIARAVLPRDFSWHAFVNLGNSCQSQSAFTRFAVQIKYVSVFSQTVFPAKARFCVLDRLRTATWFLPRARNCKRACR